jgi:uncharacterized membrane protein (UPF0182 family)
LPRLYVDPEFSHRAKSCEISQNTQISQDFALWENSGSTYSRGNMFVVPIENSIMYVEPIYLRSTSGSMPEVKRVIIYYNGRIAYEETLRAALRTMFDVEINDDGTATWLKDPGFDQPQDPPPIDSPAPPPKDPVDPQDPTDPPTEGDGGLESLSYEELIDLAQAAFDRGQQAMRNGDWAAYGEAQAELEAILAALAKAR